MGRGLATANVNHLPVDGAELDAEKNRAGRHVPRGWSGPRNGSSPLLARKAACNPGPDPSGRSAVPSALPGCPQGERFSHVELPRSIPRPPHRSFPACCRGTRKLRFVAGGFGSAAWGLASSGESTRNVSPTAPSSEPPVTGPASNTFSSTDSSSCTSLSRCSGHIQSHRLCRPRNKPLFGSTPAFNAR